MALEKTLPIVLLFCIGLLLKRMKVLRPEHAPLLSQLIFKVALPSTVVNSLAATELSPKLLLLPITGLAIVTILLGIGYVLAPLMGLEGKTRAAFIMAFPSLELGSIGYAFMLAVYGERGLNTIVLVDLGSGFFFFTVVAFLASAFGQSTERFRVSTALKTFLANPVIAAYAIGIAIHLLHVQNALLSNLSTALAQPLLLLIMFLLAVECELKPTSLSTPLLGVYLKMSIGVVVGVILSLLFGFTGVTRIAVVLAASLPTSLMTVVYARENGLDSQFLASMLSLALPISIVGSSLLISLSH